MGSDLFALSALAAELNEILKGARIDKIQQPEPDEFRFFMRAGGVNRCLCISCNAGAPRMHLTDNKKQSPQNAPALCMLLRKHLINAVVDHIGIYNSDRIIGIKFNAKTEMRDEAVFYLFVEIMNRYSNIVFTDAELVILDAVKHLPLDVARDHVVLHGVRYEPVGQPKTSYLNDCSLILKGFDGGDLHRYILDNVSGFSGVSVSELLNLANLENVAQKLTQQQLEALENGLEVFKNIRSSKTYAPCVIAGKEVYPYPYNVLCADNANFRRFDTMSEAYDSLYTATDGEIRNKVRLKSLSSAVKRLRAKVEKNINVDVEKLEECKNMDCFRIYGELVVTNIYLIKKGDKSLKCFDYYAGSEVEIPLDERLSPSKNSVAYYNKYNKLKRTKEFVETKLEDDKILLDYVASLEEELCTLPINARTNGIEEELSALGGARKNNMKGKVRKEKAEPPYVYVCDGFYIYRGKNNLQNDELTFKFASSSDVWLHLKNEHGAHTIIAAEGRTVPENVLAAAAEITASTKTASAEVDYTQRRNVKRKPGGHPGQVVYVNYNTILATPNAHQELLV